MVEVLRMPHSWAVSMTSHHCAVVSLLRESTRRTESSRISAAVPGSVSRPFSFNISRYSRTGMPVSSMPYTISMGEKAWACMFGVADFTARKTSR